MTSVLCCTVFVNPYNFNSLSVYTTACTYRYLQEDLNLLTTTTVYYKPFINCLCTAYEC